MESQELQGRVARLYYQHGMTHQEIAQLLGLSRVKVTRLVAEARRSGIVEIKIQSSSAPFADLEAELLSNYGLQQVWISPSFTDHQRTSDSIALVAAECLNLLVPTSGTVGVGLSSTVAAVLPRLHAETKPNVGFVPISGSWGGVSRGMNPHELALKFGAAFGAQAYHLPVPLLASSARIAEAFRAGAEVHKTLQIAADADLLITGIGGMGHNSSRVIDFLDDSEYRELFNSGAVGETSARFFNADGHPVISSVDERVVGLTLAEIRSIPQRLVIAFGPHKVHALTSAINAGIINMLVTDVNTAKALTAEDSLVRAS